MAELTIKSMGHGHLSSVTEIEEEVFKNPWTEEMFRQEVEDNQISRAYVALDGEQLIGYIVAWFLRDEIHLLNIAVVPSCQRRGIGRRLMHFLIDVARRERKEMITLEVRESNEVAIELYRSLGFTPIGIHREYYQDDKEHALLMARPVVGPTERE